MPILLQREYRAMRESSLRGSRAQKIKYHQSNAELVKAMFTVNGRRQPSRHQQTIIEYLQSKAIAYAEQYTVTA